MEATANSPADLATVTPPPDSTAPREPMGASMTGMRSLSPRKVDEQSTADTSRSTRGRKAMESRARRLRFRVVSVSAPPTT